MVFEGAVGRPPGGWTNRGICVGSPECTEEVVPLSVAIAPVLLTEGDDDDATTRVPVGTTFVVKVFVPVGRMEVGARLDVLAALVASDVSAAVTETELSEVAEITVVEAPLDGWYVKVAELEPMGTTVVAELASGVADESVALPDAVAEAAGSVDV